VRDSFAETNTNRHPCQFVASSRLDRPRRQNCRPISYCRGVQWVVVLATLTLISAGPVGAGDVSKDKEQMRSLDEQVQEIKSEVLGIAAELSRLEERLLYPSNTQIAVFVSLAEGEDSRLDSVQIQLDGEFVAHHIYSFKELDALQKGGVQRIYTGNVPTGEHRIEVSVAGKLTSGREFGGTESFNFSKDVEPKLVGIELATTATGDASIQLGGW
jgi:hypothetical protein